MLISPFKLRSAFSRGLGLLLVAFIFFGTTVNAAHRHGRVLPSRTDGDSLTRSGQTANPAGASTGCSDCLLCQLHQNLNTTLISYRLVNPPERLQLRIPVTVPQEIISRTGSANTGRAPPFIS